MAAVGMISTHLLCICLPISVLWTTPYVMTDLTIVVHIRYSISGWYSHDLPKILLHNFCLTKRNCQVSVPQNLLIQGGSQILIYQCVIKTLFNLSGLWLHNVYICNNNWSIPVSKQIEYGFTTYIAYILVITLVKACSYYCNKCQVTYLANSSIHKPN